MLRDAPQGGTVVRFEIAPRSIALILATILGVWLFLQLRVIALLLVVALVFAGTFNPLIEWLGRRGLKRLPALALLFVGLLLVTALMIFLIVPPLIEQFAGIVRDLPSHRETFVALLRQREATLPLAHAVENTQLEPVLARIESQLVGYSPRILEWFGYTVTMVALTFYLLADGKRSQGVLYALVPREYHMRLARILYNLETIVGGYMRGQLITSVSVGLFTWLLLSICHVPNALFLALFAALVDVIPFVGAFLASGPAVLAGLGVSVTTGLVVLAVLFVYQEIENRVIIPKVYGHVLRLSPAAVVVALLSGGLLGGIIGALLALPIAAGLQMIVLELGVELPGDDSDDRSAQARRARAEADYERMSAGSTAPEAGEIARNLAHSNRDADAALAADAAKEPAGVAP